MFIVAGIICNLKIILSMQKDVRMLETISYSILETSASAALGTCRGFGITSLQTMKDECLIFSEFQIIHVFASVWH